MTLGLVKKLLPAIEADFPRQIEVGSYLLAASKSQETFQKSDGYD
jgi:hypothetical protein